MITLNTLQKIYPNANIEHLIEFEKQHEHLFDKYNIPNHQVTKFMAQIGHESGGLQFMIENLNYSASGLRKTWRSRFPSTSIANQYARNPEKIANKVYANRMGNGSPASGDGWKFRGHGYIQLTGKDAYIQVGNIIGLSLVNDPKLTINPKHALEVVCGVWVWKGLNKIDNFVSMTKRINGGLHGLSDRKNWLYKINREIKNPPLKTNSSTKITKQTIFKIQQELNNRGYRHLVGNADGIIGSMTRAGIKKFKLDNNLGNNSDIDNELLAALGI